MRSILLLAAALIATPAAAQTDRQPYKALGTEPGWTLTIDSRSLRYEGDYGRTRINVARPRPIAIPNGTRYRTRRLSVDITHVRCSDGMSDRMFADTVKLTIGRRRLSGCGGAVIGGEANLADTRWAIAAVNGRTVTLAPRVNDIRFTADRVSGRAGCNQLGGSYTFTGRVLTPRDVIATRMACAGEPMRIEGAFLRLLAAPAQVKWTGDTLTLSGRTGSVTLRRAR